MWCCRDGRIWLTVLYKTWIKKDPATARAREAKKEAVLAALMGDEESLLSGKDKKKRKTSLAERKDKEKESKRPKTDDGMDLVQVKQERDEAEAEAELPTHLKVMIKGEVKSEPAARLESITKEESADVERKLKMDRTMSAVLLPSSFRVPPCRPTDPLLHTGRNPHRHGDETPGAAGGGLGLELFDQGGAQLPVPRYGAAPVLLAGAPFRTCTIVLFLSISKHLIHNSFPGRAYPQTRE